jgi:hypothetical protein
LGWGQKKSDSANNKLLFVFPFDIEDDKMSETISGMKELDRDLLGLTKLR